MTRRGAVTLSDADASDLVGRVARELAAHGQIRQVAARDVLAALTAHHVLERVEYPQTAFQFEHQQLQEYYAATDVRSQLVSLVDGDGGKVLEFMGRYARAGLGRTATDDAKTPRAVGDAGNDKRKYRPAAR